MTPEQLQAEREKYGIPSQGFGGNVSSISNMAGTPNVQDKLSKLDMAWGKSTVLPKDEGNIITDYFGNVGKIYKKTPGKLIEDIKSGAQDIEKGDVIKGVAKSGVRTAADAANSIFAPISVLIGTILEKTGGQVLIDDLGKTIADKSGITDLPAFQKFAMEHPNAGEDFNRLLMLILSKGEKGKIEPSILFDRTKMQIETGIKKGKTILENKAFQKSLDYSLELTVPKITAKTSETAIESGMVKAPGIFSKGKINPSSRDNLVAESVIDVVSPRNNVSQNVDSIRGKISQTNRGVGDMIKDNKIPFNEAQLRSKLNAASEENSLVFASDVTASRIYNAVVEEFIKHVKNKDTFGLFIARQTFDKIPAIKKLLESERMGENVRRQIVLDVRRAANEYVAEQLPVNNPYRKFMMDETRMLEALGNIAEKNVKIIGKNKLQLLVDEYPILKWIIGGFAGAAGVGVGGAIVGSTD